MTTAHLREKEAVIDRLIGLLQERLPRHGIEPIIHFARLYYARSAAEDLLSLSLENLYGSLLSHWHLVEHRKPGTPLIHVYNPVYEEHSWHSPHTVIEVVTDDMPFLVDSLNMYLVRQGVTIHVTLHPVINVQRNDAGQITAIAPPNTEKKGYTTEAVMRFEVDRQSAPEALAALHAGFEDTLNDVRLVVEDWQPLCRQIKEIITTLDAQQLPIPTEEKSETLAFLRWLENNHFTFIGFRAYDLVDEEGGDLLRPVEGSALGIFRGTQADHLTQSFTHIPPPQRGTAHPGNLLVITKTTAHSTVHRPAHLDYLGIKRFDENGEVVGEWRFIGLYGSTVYNTLLSEIPILRRKVMHVMEQARLRHNSHGGKAMQHILATFPRDEMFQISEEELLEIAVGILQVQDRHRLSLFLRRDPFDRFISAFVYVPRDHYNTELRLKIQDILLQALNGESAEFEVQFSTSIFARVHFIVHTQPDKIPEYDRSELEARLAEAMLSWNDELHIALHEQFGEGGGLQLAYRYTQAFPAAYKDDFTPRAAVLDIQYLEEISADGQLSTHLYRPIEGSDNLLRFKVYGRCRPMALSDVLPMLERMGLRVLGARPYTIEAASDCSYWILDFDMMASQGIEVEVLAVKENFQNAFARICSGEIENDGFNRLLLAASLAWRPVVVLRAICKYLLQTQAPFSQSYMSETLAQNPQITSLLASLFLARFDPDAGRNRDKTVDKLTHRIENAFDAVANLDQDRILRRYLAVIQAMLRTNYFQLDNDGQPKPYLSFKLDPSRVPDLPLPRPMFEIFVYSPTVEGVHLRGGPVARGGLRWSDRREDFRTEILGLMKAQMVKNAVIVPVGAKGGFVPKRLPDSQNRDVIQEEVVRCYRTFICGMLDLTDNLLNGAVVTPPHTVRYDDDDTYLVVAADKGTATFSDIANGIAEEYNFWLGDGFASGGSSGYDHKKMGITARGGWESVKRLFGERGIDCQNQDFSVVGIGDMAGDVFGNGMLLSQHTKLVAAFNHLHIFIDPNPDPKRSFEERERLFKLPRSNWSDYDPAALSTGGGIYSRSAKSIPLSSEAQQALGIEAGRLTPNELIRAILKAPVDLLWNGGIGTYVKASEEHDSDVGDRINDPLRIDASELQCSIVGEGGNLGLTQLARVEYARQGGLINADFIDNAGGVDCSDHEVNIKILLNQVVRAGDMTLKQRNLLLTRMTDEVSALVLQHNYLQTQTLSMGAIQAGLMPFEHIRLMRTLEKEGRLKRKLEHLPDDASLAKREKAGEGLSRPELAVLLAYSKITLFEELCASDICEDSYLAAELIKYFPSPMQEHYAQHMQQHPLKREIIATQITNSLINRMGSTFILRMQDETGEHAAVITRAYAAAREIFQVRRLWKEIAALDNQVPAQTRLDMLIEIRRLHDHTTLWLLRNRRHPLDIAATIDQYRDGATQIIERIPKVLEGEARGQFQKMVRQYGKAGVPRELARHIASLEAAYPTLNLLEVTFATEIAPKEVTDIYFKLGFALELFWLRDRIQELPRTNYWQRKARMALRYDLYMELRALTQSALEQTRHIRGTKGRITHWLEQNATAVTHCQRLLADIRASSSHDLAMLSVAMRELRSLMMRRDGNA
ncbi:MAG: NAD-glutamate dehydrogenase [Candidatus Polarisedimenticolaceae bacterium]|nr:NAD-glutamate dehydrogenase [Candidatus Polarisedimenticolaceae bacterium]